MGNRANVAIIHRSYNKETKTAEIDGILYCYFHNEGGRIRDLAIEAVTAARNRWDDPSYANRIALRSMFADYDSETGAGFGLEPGDNESGRSWYLIDWQEETVTLMPYSLLYSPLEDKIAYFKNAGSPVTPFDKIAKLPRIL